MLSQEQYLVLQQRIRQVSVKIELLNQDDIVLDSFEGYSTSGSLNMQSDSAYRRSGSLSMIVTNGDLLPKSESKIWFNRKIRVFIGLKNFSDEMIWFNQGIYVIQDASVSHSKSEVSLDISLNDLMSLIDGTINGNVSHEIKVIAQGNLISDEIRQALSLLGKVSIDNIEIDGLNALVPYQIVVSPDTTVYDHVKKLLDLYMGMEMFYDDDGFIIIRKVRDRKNDPILWDFTSDGLDLVIDSKNKIDFANVRNSIYLWGKKKDNGETVKWVYRNRYARNTVLDMKAITDKKIGDICYVYQDNKSYYWNGKVWYWNNSIPTDNISVNPIFNIEAIGEKIFAHTDESIHTEKQAEVRAQYELKNRNHLAESVSLSCVPLYGLNPNDKIYLKNDKNGIEGEYLVKSLGYGMTPRDSMNLEAEKIQY